MKNFVFTSNKKIFLRLSLPIKTKIKCVYSLFKKIIQILICYSPIIATVSLQKVNFRGKKFGILIFGNIYSEKFGVIGKI